MTNRFYKKSFAFWFVLLIIALFNATVREIWYKPLLTPYIGTWAHQISSVIAIVLFFVAIYIFLKRFNENYTQKDLIRIGLLWIFMTLIFETGMNMFLRNLSFEETVQTYYFWKGETWIFVLLSLLVSPQIIYTILRKRDFPK